MGLHWPSHSANANRESAEVLVVVYYSAETPSMGLVEVFVTENWVVCQVLDGVMCPSCPPEVLVSLMVLLSWSDIQDC
jgi:hypothetical protein